VKPGLHYSIYRIRFIIKNIFFFEIFLKRYRCLHYKDWTMDIPTINRKKLNL